MKVLISDPISISGIDLLKKAGLSVDYLPELIEDELKNYVSDIVQGLEPSVLQGGSKDPPGHQK